MLLECQNCGAPLDVKADARIVKCHYCGRASQVASQKTIAAQTPDGWRPPPVWTPPAQFPAPSLPIRYHRQSRAPLVAAVVLVLVMASGAFVAMALLGGSEPSSAGFSAGGTPTQVVIEQGGMPRVSPIPGATPVGDGKSTLSCSIGGELVIDGRQLNVDGTVIDAAINCRIRIKNSRLKGRTVIAGAMTAQIRIENSTLEAEHAAIDCAMACDITIEKNSKLVSRDGGVRLAQGSKLRIDESTIDAQGVAIDVGRASNVRIERSKISGKRAALEIESPGDLVLTSTTISGKKKVEKGVRISER